MTHLSLTLPDMSLDIASLLQSRRETATAGWQDVSGGASQASSGASFAARVDQELEDLMEEDAEGHPLPALEDAAVVEEARLGQPSLQDEEDNQETDQQLAIPVLSEPALENAKKRRLMPGASTTAHAFDSLFEMTIKAFHKSLEEVPPVMAGDLTSGSVQQQARKHLQYVHRQRPEWSEEMICLGAAAINVHRVRLSDIFVRDYVGLIWIIEGERYIRAHRGVCYLYHTDGAFEAYTGVPPESTF